MSATIVDLEEHRSRRLEEFISDDPLDLIEQAALLRILGAVRDGELQVCEAFAIIMQDAREKAKVQRAAE